MPDAPATSAAVADFLRRWEASGAAERANYQLFLSELCDLLKVPRPEPTQPDDRNNAYVFERAVTFRHGTGLTRETFPLYRNSVECKAPFLCPSGRR